MLTNLGWKVHYFLYSSSFIYLLVLCKSFFDGFPSRFLVLSAIFLEFLFILGANGILRIAPSFYSSIFYLYFLCKEKCTSCGYCLLEIHRIIVSLEEDGESIYVLYHFSCFYVPWMNYQSVQIDDWKEEGKRKQAEVEKD